MIIVTSFNKYSQPKSGLYSPLVSEYQIYQKTLTFATAQPTHSTTHPSTLCSARNPPIPPAHPFRNQPLTSQCCPGIDC